ncbi:Origin of replication complex subunit 6 [Dipsacomyces acuminosporus]|nr:Origin of replication complex subunit 6 [Dipsacomyces acuminosporus]
MTSILTQQISRLQLDHIPNLSAKAAQLFDQICRRIVHPKNKMLMLCRQCIAIQLACEGLSVEFNEVAASSISAVSLRSYQVCVQETKVALGLNKNITLEELDVQFGPPQLVIEYSRRLLDEFKQSLSATMSPAVSRVMDWANSVYIAAAFYLVCKHLKKRIVAKPKLIILASTKPSVFANAVAKLEQYGRNTLAEMDSGSVAAPRTPARKRARVDGEGNTKVGAASSGVSASANAAAPDPATRKGGTHRQKIASNANA